MYGAIFGDIIASRFEYDYCGWNKYFMFFTTDDGFTDATVMTVAIAGAMAEGMYSIPALIVETGKKFLPNDIQDVLDRLSAAIGICWYNQPLKRAANRFFDNKNSKNLYNVINVIIKRILEGAEVPMPMVDVQLKFDTMISSSDSEWLPLFTDEYELSKGDTADIKMNVPILSVIQYGYDFENIEGVVINPFENPTPLTKKILEVILDCYEEIKTQEYFFYEDLYSKSRGEKS